VVEGGEPLEFRTTYQSDFVKMVPIDKYWLVLVIDAFFYEFIIKL
jgi:hypothetical protein